MSQDSIAPQDTSQTGYDAEWALEDGNTDSPPKVAVNDSEQDRKTEDEGTAPESTAQDGTQDAPKGESGSKAAEPETDEPFAGMTEDQIAAHRKAERDGKAMAGRHRLAQDRMSHLEKQLDEQRKLNGELTDQARTPSEFEQAHPEYFKELKDEFGTKGEPSSPDVDAGKSEYDEADAIIDAHPDAGDVYASAEFNTWLSAQPPQSMADINSTQASEVIPVIAAYKTYVADAEKANLQSIADVGGTSAQPDLRVASQRSSQELYDAEWANDD